MKMNLTIRAAQVIAAIYFRNYCHINNISDPSVDEFVNHMFSVATAKSLPDWEQIGTNLELTGRGDPLPQNLKNNLNEQGAKMLDKLSQDVRDIGLSQMYAATNMKMVYKYLKNVEKIARKSGIKKIEYKLFETGQEGWGEPVSQETLNKWCSCA
jgi:hypothetical protein